ncbi:MAG: hypothetical protein D6677_05150 [Calditrichaeota bacterium]|nr:MAG: hypothetical protein D6677_05150 [Calditrichota bacterium]
MAGWTDALRERLKDGLYSLQNRVGRHDYYYLLFARRFPFNRMGVSPETGIVIEGFPRSANSYAVVAFKLVNPDVPIGHHLHVPIQLIRAVRFHIPAILVLRAPEEAVASFMVFQGSYNADVYIREYIRFHTSLLPYKDHILVASFETITGDMNTVIDALNQRFGTRFKILDDPEKQEETIFHKLQEVNARFFGKAAHKSMYPDASRNAQKALAQRKVLQSPFLVEARNLYSLLNKDAV